MLKLYQLNRIYFIIIAILAVAGCSSHAKISIQPKSASIMYAPDQTIDVRTYSLFDNASGFDKTYLEYRYGDLNGKSSSVITSKDTLFWATSDVSSGATIIYGLALVANVNKIEITYENGDVVQLTPVDDLFATFTSSPVAQIQLITAKGTIIKAYP